MKKKLGRPVTKGGRDPQRSLRVPDVEWVAWQRLAESKGVTLSMLIRETMGKLLRRQR